MALPNIEDGAWHPVVVTWNAATQTLSYTFDGQPMGTLTGDIATQFLGGSNFAHFGFGAGTGGLTNTQSVRNVTVSATLEGQTPGNGPPIAQPDTATTPAGTAVNIAVLANDSDPEGDPLTVRPVSNFVGGTPGSTATTRSPIPPTRASAVPAASPTRSTTERRRVPPRQSPCGHDAAAAAGAVTLTPHGSASVAGNVFTLTTAGNGVQAGTAMSTQRIDVRENFTVAFEVNLGSDDAGADGAAVVFHNDARGADAIGAPGSDLGITGIANGLAIEFDTFGEIASDHTNFRAATGGFATPRVALPDIEDGAWHPVVVSWNAATQTMSYTFDGQPMGTLTGDIATQFLGGSNFAHFGFGAATGGLTNTQSVRNVTVSATLEGQTPGNSPPIAQPDTAATTVGTAVNIAVLSNDSDPEGNPLTVRAVSNFVGGTPVINGNNTITYTPNPGFSGSGSFTYTNYDGTTESSPRQSPWRSPPPPPPGAVTLTPHGSASVAGNVFTLTTAGTGFRPARRCRLSASMCARTSPWPSRSIWAATTPVPTGRPSCSITMPVAPTPSEPPAATWGSPVSRTGWRSSSTPSGEIASDHTNFPPPPAASPPRGWPCPISRTGRGIPSLSAGTRQRRL